MSELAPRSSAPGLSHRDGAASASHEVLDRVVKAYDIRGLCPGELDADMCWAIGAAFAEFALAVDGARQIVIGRDMRPTGVELSAAFARGAVAAGLDVVDLGLCSTDEVYFASGRLGSAAAMLTASHNPAEYNGIKLCLANARPIGADSGLADIKARAAELLTSGDCAAFGRPEGAVHRRDILDEFAQHVRSFVDVEALAPLNVVADTANGMGGLVVPAVFEAIPGTLEVMYGELDGSFPNHPADPIQPENQADLRARVVEAGADLGLAFDGDADRVFLVDEKGEGLSGSTTTAIIAAAMLKRSPGAPVIYNLICSKSVPEVIGELGGVPVRTRVGHSFIKAEMATSGAVFGGEHSAHYYFRDNWRADSGLIAALVVMEAMSTSGLPLSELRKPYERYAASGEINSRVEDAQMVIQRVRATMLERYPSATIDELDGTTVDLGDWWFNLRASNTEPLLRLNLEAADVAACAQRTEELLDLIRK
jgi:phosphomannomutase